MIIEQASKFNPIGFVKSSKANGQMILIKILLPFLAFITPLLRLFIYPFISYLPQLIFDRTQYHKYANFNHKALLALVCIVMFTIYGSLIALAILALFIARYTVLSDVGSHVKLIHPILQPSWFMSDKTLNTDKKNFVKTATIATMFLRGGVCLVVMAYLLNPLLTDLISGGKVNHFDNAIVTFMKGARPITEPLTEHSKDMLTYSLYAFGALYALYYVNYLSETQQAYKDYAQRVTLAKQGVRLSSSQYSPSRILEPQPPKVTNIPLSTSISLMLTSFIQKIWRKVWKW